MTRITDYLEDILREIDDVEAFTTEGRTAFMLDRRTQKAVIRSYEIIGEIAKRLPAEMRDANLQIDWRRLITFRDFLAHNYDMVVLSYVWGAVEDLHSSDTYLTINDTLYQVLYGADGGFTHLTNESREKRPQSG